MLVMIFIGLDKILRNEIRLWECNSLAHPNGLDIISLGLLGKYNSMLTWYIDKEHVLVKNSAS